MTAVAERGIYSMSEAEYHANPALSSSGARKLLPPSCPALFRYEQDNPPEPKAVFDLGHAAHKMVLGVGPEVVRSPFDDFRTKAAREWRDDVRSRGDVPLGGDDYETVRAMARAILAHPIASSLLADGTGTAEPSLFWQDEQTGVTRRARPDWLPNRMKGRTIISEYKSARSAEREKFMRAAMDYGYHQQGTYYLDGVRALELADDPVFVFIAQEKTPPFLVNVIQLDVRAVRIGNILNRRAINLFAECTRDDRWPGYSDEVEIGSLPAYYERQFEDQL